MNRIRSLRKKHDITQEQLGSIVNVQKSAISKYELGRSDPSPDVLRKMADYFGVTIDYLLGSNRDIDATQKAKQMFYDDGIISLGKNINQISFDGTIYDLSNEQLALVKSAVKAAVLLAIKEDSKISSHQTHKGDIS